MGVLTDKENQSRDENVEVLYSYYTLLKPRVMSLVVFSGFVGLWVAPGRADTVSYTHLTLPTILRV